MSAAAAWPRWRMPLGAPLVFLIAVLLLAGAVHVCAILLVPSVAPTDGWSRLIGFAGGNRFGEVPLAGADAGAVAGLDPLFVNGACRLQLADNPAAIALEARDRFWSLALYDPKGTIIFSLNDRTAVEGRLDMVVVNAAQNAEMKRSAAAELEQAIVVESPSDDLIALLRLYAPTAAAQAEARRIIAAAECAPDPLPSLAPSSG